MMDHMALLPPGLLHLPQPSTASPDPPIDPSLAIDPAILNESSNNVQVIPSQPPHRSSSPVPVSKLQLEQAPQGDPFASQQQQQTDSFSSPVSPPRPLKRKRKFRPVVRRDDTCSFCQGDDAHNKGGFAEQMVSCVACGRSGHPSCLGIAGIADVLRSYPWHCIECKICEVCEKKGNGNRMLFCDACDRGWHMDCLQPPLEDTPNGSWVCPLCPPIPLMEVGSSSPMPHRAAASPAPSATSSAHYQQNESKSRSRAHVKNKSKTQYVSDSDEEKPPRVRYKNDKEVHPANRRKEKKGGVRAQVDSRGRGRAAPEDSRLRLRTSLRGRSKDNSSSPGPPIHTARRVRLVVKRPKVTEDDEDDEDKDEPSHIFEGILTPAEYNTANTMIHDSDRSFFNRSRARAEAKLGPPVAPIFPSALLASGSATPNAPNPAPSTSLGNSLIHTLRTRHSVAQALQFHAALVTPPGTPQPGATSNQPAASTLPPRIRTIRFGEYDVDTWYDAPFPEEYASVSDGKLWICEFCLKYMKSRFQSTRHRMKCKVRHPPGDEIYRDGTISVFEVDGRKNKIYCQNLCLLSKMFLDHKSLFYDVEPFLFYVMTEVDRLGARFVGYFSKEKRSPKDYNVSCIMTLPVRQRKGWGNILIDFSYLLSKKEGRIGTPERPLSALGALAYRQYWTHTIKMFLRTAPGQVKLEDISRATSMTLEDIYNTLREQNMITAKEAFPAPPPRPPPGTPIKYLRGRKNGPGITRRSLIRTNTKDDSKGQTAIPAEYTISWDREALEAYASAWQAKEHVTISPRCLKWTPFILSRAPMTQTEQDESDKSPTEAPAGANVPEVDRSSASSTMVPQAESVNEAASTVKDKSALLDLAIAAEMQMPAGAEDSKPRLTNFPSHNTDGTEDNGNAADGEQTSAASRVLRARNRTLRGGSVIQGASPPSGSESLAKRSLRSFSSRGDVKRKRRAEYELMQDSLLAANLAEEYAVQQRRTRSSLRMSAKPESPRVLPRKRRRVESSSEPELEPNSVPDADGSLSELTRTSSSNSPSPPRRRITRAVNGQFSAGGDTRERGGGANGVSRSTRSNPQSLGLSVRSSSRINGAARVPPSALKQPMLESQGGRTRSTRQMTLASVTEDPDSRSKVPVKLQPELKARQCERREEEGDGTQAGMEASSNHSPLTTVANLVNGTEPKGGTLGQFGTPALYGEDELGEEDAEGEEDPNPDSDVEA